MTASVLAEHKRIWDAKPALQTPTKRQLRSVEPSDISQHVEFGEKDICPDIRIKISYRSRLYR